MVGAAAYFITGLASIPAVDPAFFSSAVAVRTEVYGVGAVGVNSDVVVHAIRIPVRDIGAGLGGLDSLDHVSGGQSDAGDHVLFACCLSVLGQFEVSIQAPTGNRTGQIVGVALDGLGSFGLRLSGLRSFGLGLCGSGNDAVKYSAGLDIVGADLFALHDLVGHLIVIGNGSHGDDVGLDLGVAVSNYLIESLDEDCILGSKLVSLVVLGSGAVRLDDVAVEVDDSVLDLRSQSGYYFGVLFAVFVSLGDGLLLELNNSVADVEFLIEVDSIDSLAIRNLEIGDNGKLVADLELVGLFGLVPVNQSNNCLAFYGLLSLFLGFLLGLYLGLSLGRGFVLAVNLDFGLGAELFLDFIKVNYLDFAGTDVLQNVRDLACAGSDYFEISMYENLLGREVVAVELYGIVAEVLTVVRNNDIAAVDVGEDLIVGVILDLLILFALDAAQQLELGLVIEQVAFELGDLTGLAECCIGGNACHVDIEVKVNDVINMSGIFFTVNCDLRIVALYRSGSFCLFGLGSLCHFGSLGSFQIEEAIVPVFTTLSVGSEVYIVGTAFGNNVIVAHAVGIPAGVLVAVVILNLERIARGECNAGEDILAFSFAVCCKLIAIGRRPTVERAY